MSSAVGMMDEAYFVGRREILEWLNGTLSLNLSKIEETASGCVALQLMDACYPGQVSIQKLNWSARNDYEFIQNYKLLQTAFDKFHVDKHIPVDKIVRAKYQDNLEFMQWFKRYVEITGPAPGYDPVAARSKGKGAPGASSGQPAARTTAARRDAAAAAAPAATRKASTTARTTGAAAAKATSTSTELTRAQDEVAELKVAVEVLEKERDFYFEKLRDVEVLLQLREEQGKPVDGMQDIFKILYATTDNCVAVSDEGQVLEGETARAYKEGAAANGEAEEVLLEA
ncbi:putative microtubule associated protein EB1 [Tribonema minus]|uniref:Putative microtubule associated protein EB1 n=1 Tax=Tribonema minus TaxID=303371 RepID=A0A836CQU4_9STRA|nr:putative microtubule associated protein EB1 [Tribonema minus]